MTELQIIDWIIAIDQTIRMWKIFLQTGIKPSCPLCLHSNKIHSLSGCDSCIHTSEFGQHIICMRQKSHKNINKMRMQIAEDPILMKTFVNTRIAYLRDQLRPKLYRRLMELNPENNFVLIP